MGFLLSYVIKGVVVGDSDGVGDAFIYVKNLGIRVYTDKKGEFEIDLKEGKYYIVVQALGFKLKRIKLDVKNDTFLRIKLEPLEYTLKEITVSPKVRSIFESSQPKFLEALPFIGDQDIGYFISIAPGVVPVYGVAYFSVRGSSPFENLITFDNIPLYNAFSYYGMYTPINLDIIGDVDFVRGCFTPDVENLSGALINFKSKEEKEEETILRFSRTNTGISVIRKNWIISGRMGLFAPLKYWKKVGIRLGDVSGKVSFGSSVKGLSFSFIGNISDNIYLNDYRGLYYRAGVLNAGISVNGRYAFGKVFLKPSIIFSSSNFTSWDSSRKDPFNPRIQAKSVDSKFNVMTLRNDILFGGFQVGSNLSYFSSGIVKDSLELNLDRPFLGFYLKYRFENRNILSEFGGRLDYFKGIGLKPSPSGYFKYYLNSSLSFKVQGGIYRQFITSLYSFPPQFFFYAPVRNSEIISYQIMLGGERIFPWGVSEINIFEKFYPDFTYITYNLEEKVAKMNSMGLDMWIRKESKVPVPLTADLSYTFMLSRIKFPDKNSWIPTPWDITHTINATSSFHLIRDSYEVILGVSVAYLVGRPYRGYLSHYRTPFYGEVFIQDTTNRLKLPPYARIDIFSRAPIPVKILGANLDVSFSVINLFPNKNVTFDPTNPDADFANLTAAYPISSIVIRAVF